MRGKIRAPFNIMALFMALLLCTGLVLPVFGQDPEEPEEPEQPVEIIQPAAKIFISGQDVTSPPSAILHVVGRDLEGNAIDFTRDNVVLSHDGTPIETTVTDSIPVGTLTVFLVDLPQGIEEQLAAIQQALQQYAGPGGMQEQVDSIAIYQVGETRPRQLLAPTTFHNEVQNFFVNDLTPESGATALRDSLAILLDEVAALKPNPDMITSVVVMSDGTDVVSTEYDVADIINRANEQNIAIHTIRVPGAGLTIDQAQQGQNFLQELADSTLGFAALLEESSSVADLWSRIAAFRDHARIRFQIDSLGGGTFDVVVSLASDPSISDSTVVEIPENQPQVFLNLPPGETLTLTTLDEPILLRLGATVTWLDDFEREIREARLRVNGLDVADIPVEQLEDFTVEVSNLRFGENDIELAIVDEQGLEATNLPATISVVQGEQQAIPEELQPTREIGSIVLNLFLLLVVIGVFVGLFLWLRRSGLISRLTSSSGRSRAARESVTYSAADGSAAMPGVMGSGEQSGSPIEAYLEVVESVSEMPHSLDLKGAMIRIGRSPSMCDIAFRDDLTVSRQHAVLMLEGYHYRLFDENSTSGSWVNGRQVPDYGVELADGDDIHLGAVHLVYRQP